MSKALATFGVGPHAEVLAISRPLLQAYAAKHGYAYVEASAIPQERPPSWYKVQLLHALLEGHDTALWVDSDTVIVDGSQDIADTVPDSAWQGLCVHTEHLGFRMGEVPSCGVWLVRKPMLPILAQVWGMTQYTNHPWWEQAALHELLGYRHNGKAIFPVTRGEPTPLRDRTHLLDESWNCIDMRNEAATPHFMHMAGLSHGERMQWMSYWAERAVQHGT